MRLIMQQHDKVCVHVGTAAFKLGRLCDLSPAITGHPDPQITLSGDHPSGNVEGSNINAFGFGIGYDITIRENWRHSS